MHDGVAACGCCAADPAHGRTHLHPTRSGFREIRPLGFVAHGDGIMELCRDCFFLDPQGIVRLKYGAVSERARITRASVTCSALYDAQRPQSGDLGGQTGPMDHVNHPGYIFIGLWHLLSKGLFPLGLEAISQVGGKDLAADHF